MEIELYKDLTKKESFSYEELIAKADKLNKFQWEQLSQKMDQLSDDFIDKFDGELDWKCFTFDLDKIPTEDFLNRYSHKIQFNQIFLKGTVNYTRNNLKLNIKISVFANKLRLDLKNNCNYENFKKNLDIFNKEIKRLKKHRRRI